LTASNPQSAFQLPKQEMPKVLAININGVQTNPCRTLAAGMSTLASNLSRLNSRTDGWYRRVLVKRRGSENQVAQRKKMRFAFPLEAAKQQSLVG
jgi:hypothetical protein